MSAQRVISNRWLHQIAGVMLAGMGIVALSQPTPAMSLRCLEDAAVHRLAPVVSKTEVGRQVLAVYARSNAECPGTI